jgi:hypothetical protein
MTERRTPYGFCPTCGSPGQFRERRLHGNDTCERGHTYPSRDAVPVGAACDGLKARTGEGTMETFCDRCGYLGAIRLPLSASEFSRTIQAHEAAHRAFSAFTRGRQEGAE